MTNNESPLETTNSSISNEALGHLMRFPQPEGKFHKVSEIIFFYLQVFLSKKIKVCEPNGCTQFQKALYF